MVCRCAYYWSEICVFNAFEDIQVPCYNVKQPEIFYKLLNRRMASLIYIKIWRQFVTPSQNTPNFACYEKRAFRYAFDARSVLKYFLRLRSVFLNAEVSEMTNLTCWQFSCFPNVVENLSLYLRYSDRIFCRHSVYRTICLRTVCKLIPYLR